MPLSPAQKGVVQNALPALAITLLCFAVVVMLTPAGTIPGSLAARLTLAGAALMLPVATLIISIGRLANHRFATPEDIDGSGLTPGSARAKLLQSLLQNTLEQTVVAIAVYLAWVVLAPNKLLPALPMAAVLFFCGRMLFFRGYARGAPGRALGFGLTFYPSALLLLVLLAVLLKRLVA